MYPRFWGVSSGNACFIHGACAILVVVMHVSLLESATFRSDDQDCLVVAALACRSCLSEQVEWSLEALDYDAQVNCRCRRCGDFRVVYVTPAQALRLALHEKRPLDPTPRLESAIVA